MSRFEGPKQIKTQRLHTEIRRCCSAAGWRRDYAFNDCNKQLELPWSFLSWTSAKLACAHIGEQGAVVGQRPDDVRGGCGCSDGAAAVPGAGVGPSGGPVAERPARMCAAVGRCPRTGMRAVGGDLGGLRTSHGVKTSSEGPSLRPCASDRQA